MGGSTFLQILLFLQVFIMGVVAALAARHAYVHFKPAKHELEVTKPEPSVEYLTPAVKEHLLKDSQVKFQAVLNRSSEQLQNDLGVTTGHINNLVLRLATEIVSGELERYRVDLSKLHDQATSDMGGISKEVAKHEAEVKAKITQELEAEKQRLIRQIDTKLADAVASFLLETLQHNVDLGSQGAYLTTMLEEHKAEIIKGVTDETQPSR